MEGCFPSGGPAAGRAAVPATPLQVGCRGHQGTGTQGGEDEQGDGKQPNW